MKPSMLVLLLIIGTFQNSVPPKKIINALKQKFPSAVDIKWQKMQHNYGWEASFNLRDKKATSCFTLDARWFRSTLEITEQELNDDVKLAVKEDYPGCKILSAIMTEAPVVTWYLVKVKCGEKVIDSGYDFHGVRFPPKIS